MTVDMKSMVMNLFQQSFQVSNPLAAVCNVGAYMHSTNLLVATSLRNVLGTKVIIVIEMPKIRTNWL